MQHKHMPHKQIEALGSFTNTHTTKVANSNISGPSSAQGTLATKP